ncbi:ABC transporter permease subunit [Mesorhizobium retamae]|uniref:ABC transporter permease subunit n=1 Tax=Mesorhizobium retamae TaxID=2912854 RepID=A0ABS9QD64_9HYPH|nr:ABC transporter permease subunit [Mesorhizobium sp. IRAMC:0171]MCG7505358.1 ABC transporter permease subunit [Mesorhizobium sp. IRAMC:0171]
MTRPSFIPAATIAAAILLLAITVDSSRWEALAQARQFFLTAIINTFYFSLAGASIGLIGGSLLASCRLVGGWPGTLAGALVMLVQALPPLLIILGCYFALPELLGLTVTPELAAVIALGSISSTYYCEAVRGAVAGVDPLQWDAAITTGLSRRASILKVILPQALPAAVPAIGTTSIVVYKLSTLLYPLGIQDFFRAAVLVNNHVIDPVLIYSLVTLFYYTTCKALTAAISQLSAAYVAKSAGQPSQTAPLTGV